MEQSWVLAFFVLAVPTWSQEPTAGPPTFQVGETWNFLAADGHKSALEILAIEGDAITTTSPWQRACLKCRTTFSPPFTPLKVADEAGKPWAPDRGFQATGPRWRYIDWPLTVGKSWSVSDKALFNAQWVDYRVYFKVVGLEDVKVKAGTFKAYKIQRDWNTQYWRGQETVWYVPEVKWYVKRTGDFATDWELEAYSLK